MHLKGILWVFFKVFLVGLFWAGCSKNSFSKLYVRDLLAPPFKIPWAYSPLVLLIGSSLYLGYCIPYSLPYRPLPSTLCDSCSACLLLTVHPGNTPYI